MKVRFLSMLMLVGSMNLYAQDEADIENGHQVFDVWCLPCHAPGPKHPGTQALDILYKGELSGVLQERTDLSVEYIKVLVRKGVSIMAPFRKTEISDDELNNLAVYLSNAGK